MAFPSKVEYLPTSMKGWIQAFNNIAFQIVQWLEPKMFGEREENGASTPQLQSMNLMHIKNKNILKGTFYQIMPFYPFLGLMQSQVSHINQPNMLTISTINTYPNTLRTIIYYHPNIKE